MLQALIEKLYSVSTATVSEVLEVYDALNNAKSMLKSFNYSNTNRSFFANPVGISSRGGVKLLLGYTKAVAPFQAKLMFLRRA